MKTKHTPGPWKVTSYYTPREENDPLGVYAVIPAQEQLEKLDDAALDCEPNSPEEQAALDRRNEVSEANARLIAAAPELLAELKQAADALMWIAQEAEQRAGVPKPIIGGARHHAAQAYEIIAKATAQP